MSNNQKIRVAVIFGGRSGEHEVSLVSATSIINNLDKEKYIILPIGITKEGKWISGQDSLQLLKKGEHPTTSNFLLAPEPKQGSELSSINAEHAIDVVFPVLHGTYGEDGTIQGLLELTGIPYVGCGVLASAVCMDKVVQKKVLASEHILQTTYDWFWKTEWDSNQEAIIKRIESNLTYPLFVKPANMGSSVGIHKAKNREDLLHAITDACTYDRKIIIEQAVINAREIEIAIMGNSEPRASVPGEIIPSNEFYDYDAKYVDGKSVDKIVDDFSLKEISAIQTQALAAYRALNCEGMARVDFLVTQDMRMYLNEVNTIPGFTQISMYPKLWQASGVPYAELLDMLINYAQSRATEKSAISTEYTPKDNWFNA